MVEEWDEADGAGAVLDADRATLELLSTSQAELVDRVEALATSDRPHQDSLDAVRAFAGDDYEVAVVPPPARQLLSRFDERSSHYEAVIEPD